MSDKNIQNQESSIENRVSKIPLEKLIAHPGNPNRMSSGTFARLVRNIERTGRYEPIIVRIKDTNTQSLGLLTENAEQRTQYEIINGHHRVKALKTLGHKTADCLIWDVDDNETDILLATLNRLAGTDELDKKLALLRRLSEKTKSKELAKLIPQNARQIERLIKLKPPHAANIKQASFLNPLTFFVNDTQYETIRRAMSLATDSKNNQTKANRNATALTRISEHFITRASQRSAASQSSKTQDKLVSAKHRAGAGQEHKSTKDLRSEI
jgi:ParB-like chromosome segregation protein Spo0J